MRRLLVCLVAILSANVHSVRVVSRMQSAAAAHPFVDATAASGLDFVHVNGATGRLLLPEVIGSGGALFDYDSDGDLDLLAIQSGPLGSGPLGSGPPGSSAGDVQGGPRLYRNDISARTSLRFTDVTARSGLPSGGYGMGATTGDFDNDGHIDLFITYLGASRLLHNNGNGTFADVTARSGTSDSRWSTSASFFDFDADGWLDLFVSNYVHFDARQKRECFSAASSRDYCNPAAYEALTSRLLRNAGDGTFSDVSSRSGIARVPGRGLGVLAADFNDDGWPDVYVANDGDPNRLWMNQRGGGVFRDEALLAGVALNRAGQPQGSMGIDLADVDRDGDEDLFVTNLDNEGHALYVSQGNGLFDDRTTEAGLFALGLTGFGTRFFDYDGDGALDLVVANGAVRHLSEQVRRGDPYPLRQRNQLFRNDGRGRFADVAERAGEPFTSLAVGRGVATGDLDNDGDSDIVVFNNNGQARVFLNDVGHRRHWLGVRVVDRRNGRDALGARLELVGKERPQVRRVQVDGSYLTAGDPRVIFGLGADEAPQSVRVRWPASAPSRFGGAGSTSANASAGKPDGHVEEFRGLAVDRYWILEQGKTPRAP